MSTGKALQCRTKDQDADTGTGTGTATTGSSIETTGSDSSSPTSSEDHRPQETGQRNARLQHLYRRDQQRFCHKYALREGDRYALRKDLRKMRLAQKALLLRMRAKFPVNCTSEDRRQDYLNYFEQESLRAVSCQSDSDDDFDFGKGI